MSWFQGCFSCTHTKSTSGCLGMGLLPPFPAWAGNTTLPLVPKSLACRWYEEGSQITPDYAMDVATELWWLRGRWAIWGWHWWVTHGARSLNKPSPPLTSKLSSPFPFPGNPLQFCCSLPHEGFAKQFLSQYNWLPLLYASLCRPPHSQSPTQS